MKFFFQNRKPAGYRAQAIVEFAIVLPILMMLLVGILEVGRLVFIYTAVTNASREAARYASAVGLDTDPDDGLHYRKFSYCKGIWATAQRSAYFMNLQPADIVIEYDHGPGTSSFVVCDDTSGEDADVVINSGTNRDRVLVTVTASYTPLVRLIPIGARDIESSSARTILGVYNLETGESSVPGGGSGGGGGGGGGGGSTATPTPTATMAETPMETPTPTNTSVGPLTPLPTYTPTDTLEPGVTPTDTPTPTSTFTPTPTFTPTATSTPVPGCDSIQASEIHVSGSSMRITITNPHEALTVSSIQVTWNHDTGGGGTKPAISLQSIILGFETWSTLYTGPSATITPASSMVIPGNNATSTLTFAFNKGYQNTDGTEAVVVHFSTSGCEAYSIYRPPLTSTPTSTPTVAP